VNKIHNSALPGGATRCEHPRVRNSALGRGLGDLMEPRPPARTATPAPESETQPESSGVRIFLKTNGTRPNTHTPAAANGSAAPRAVSKPLLAALFLADFILCCLAWWVIARSNSAVGWLGWTLVAAAVGMGAWLGVLGFLTLAPRRPPRHPNGDAHINGGG
jgi:hypothetical protein